VEHFHVTFGAERFLRYLAEKRQDTHAHTYTDADENPTATTAGVGNESSWDMSRRRYY